jgi:hypothetical protein
MKAVNINLIVARFSAARNSRADHRVLELCELP